MATITYLPVAGGYDATSVAITGGTIGGLTAFSIAANGIVYDATTTWVGINTASVRINGAVGSAGITIAGTGTVGAFLELRAPTAATTRVAGGIIAYQGTSTPLCEIDFVADGNNASGKYIFYTLNVGAYVTALQIFSTGSVVVGAVALATNATDGFLYIPTCAGVPSGVPTTRTGTVPMVFNTAANKLMIYDGGWLGATVPGTFV